MWALQMELVVKNLPVNAGDVRDARSISESSGSSRYKPRGIHNFSMEL